MLQEMLIEGGKEEKGLKEKLSQKTTNKMN